MLAGTTAPCCAGHQPALAAILARWVSAVPAGTRTAIRPRERDAAGGKGEARPPGPPSPLPLLRRVEARPRPQPSLGYRLVDRWFRDRWLRSGQLGGYQLGAPPLLPRTLQRGSRELGRDGFGQGCWLRRRSLNRFRRRYHLGRRLWCHCWQGFGPRRRTRLRRLQPLRQVALLLAAFLDQLLQRADSLEEAVAKGRQDRRAGPVEDLALHGQALDLGSGSGEETDAAGFGGRDFFRTEVQETTLINYRKKARRKPARRSKWETDLRDTAPLPPLLSQ